MIEHRDSPEEEIEINNQPPVERIPPDFDTIESLLRLLVGAGIEAPAELIERLKKWEAIADDTHSDSTLAEAMAADKLRYALVGFLFESQAQVRGGVSRIGRLVNASSRIFLKSVRPMTQSKAMQPVTSRYDKLVQRGEATVDRWIARGRSEEPRSRLIARQGLGRTIDEVINHLAENPEIRDMVAQQSAGIAEEMVDGVRSRTVAADTILERLARGILNRPPREQLPPPTSEVISQGTKITTILNEEEEGR